MQHSRSWLAGLLPLLVLLALVMPARAEACDAATAFHSDFADPAHIQTHWQAALGPGPGETRFRPWLIRAAGEGADAHLAFRAGGLQAGARLDSRCERFHFGSYRFNVAVAATSRILAPRGLVFGLFLYRERPTGEPANEIDVEFLTRWRGEPATAGVNFASHTASGAHHPRAQLEPLLPTCRPGARCWFGFDWYPDRIDFTIEDQVVASIEAPGAIPQLPGEVRINYWSGYERFGGEHPWRRFTSRLYAFTYEPFPTLQPGG